MLEIIHLCSSVFLCLSSTATEFMEELVSISSLVFPSNETESSYLLVPTCLPRTLHSE